MAKLLLRKLADILSIEKDLSICGFDEAQNRPGSCGFTTAALADKTEAFTPVQMETNAVNGMYVPNSPFKNTALYGEVLCQIFDLQEPFSHDFKLSEKT
jgi:hypothetical protein